MLFWPGKHRNTDGGIDGVVDSGPTMAIAHNRQLDQILAGLSQAFIVQPTPGWKIGQQDTCIFPTGADDRPGELPALGLANINGHGALILVKALPEEAGIVLGDRPAPVVQPAPDVVDADNLGPHLGQCQPGGGRRHKGGNLNHAQACQNTHQEWHSPLSSASCNSCRAITFRASVSSAPSKMDSTRASTK